MSYGMAAALQTALYQHLAADPALTALTGGAIFDAAPRGAVPDLYITLGPEEARERGDGSGAGAEHRVSVSVVSAGAGFLAAKQAAAIVSDSLEAAAPSLDRGRLVSLTFLRARARRSRDGKTRRIDLTFRARVDDGA
jgi:hypothetical protein